MRISQKAMLIVVAGGAVLVAITWQSFHQSPGYPNTDLLTTDDASSLPSPLQKSPSILLGVFMNTRSGRGPHEQLLELEKTIGRTLAIEMRYAEWDGAFEKREKLTLDEGRTPMISWTVNARTLPNKCAVSKEIVGGVYDAQLVKQAVTLRELQKPVMVRWLWEMTTSAAAKCFYRDLKVKDDIVAGKQYVDAWRHIVDLFRREGATNVVWVWAPGEPAFYSDQWRQYYPGNEYVDWVASDNYNKDHTALIDFGKDEGINAFYDATKDLGKPLMITETGGIYAETSESMPIDPQTKWIASAQTALPLKFPLIKGFLYWDAIGENDRGKYNDYIMRGSGLEAFKRMANDPYFGAMTIDGL